MVKSTTTQERCMKTRAYTMKHKNCVHQCHKSLEEMRSECCGGNCEDCSVECFYDKKGVFCLSFREQCGDAIYSPMYWCTDLWPEKLRVKVPIVTHACEPEDKPDESTGLNV